MARMKLMTRKDVRVLLRRNALPMESHSDGQNVGYFPRTLRTVLLALGSSEPPLFIRALRLLCGNSYLWYVHVVIYERPTTDRIPRIRQVVEAPAPRWTFEGGMREAAREALAILRHEVDEELESINWLEFRAAFRALHVPQGVIKLKKKEFQDLKQGSMFVNEYVTKFTQLSRYALHEVDTDEKKHECFLNGLNDGMAYALEARDF
jgi:hypothetical protein